MRFLTLIRVFVVTLSARAAEPAAFSDVTDLSHGFRATAPYLDDSGQHFSGRFIHEKTGFMPDRIQVQSVPQGEPHTQHLLAGKSDADPAMLHPDYTAEEIAGEGRNFGVPENQATHDVRLEETNKFWNEMVSSMAKRNGATIFWRCAVSRSFQASFFAARTRFTPNYFLATVHGRNILPAQSTSLLASGDNSAHRRRRTTAKTRIYTKLYPRDFRLVTTERE